MFIFSALIFMAQISNTGKRKQGRKWSNISCYSFKRASSMTAWLHSSPIYNFFLNYCSTTLLSKSWCQVQLVVMSDCALHSQEGGEMDHLKGDMHIAAAVFGYRKVGKWWDDSHLGCMNGLTLTLHVGASFWALKVVWFLNRCLVAESVNEWAWLGLWFCWIGLQVDLSSALKWTLKQK